jgi:hypothetical protein
MRNRWMTALCLTMTVLAACRDGAAGGDGGTAAQCYSIESTDTCNPGDIAACTVTPDGGDSGTFVGTTTCLDDGSGYGPCCE